MKTELDKPIVVMLPWLLAKPNHIKKYAQLYIDNGFEVLTVTVTPWQVLWPKKGIQVNMILKSISYAILIDFFFCSWLQPILSSFWKIT